MGKRKMRRIREMGNRRSILLSLLEWSLGWAGSRQGRNNGRNRVLLEAKLKLANPIIATPPPNPNPNPPTQTASSSIPPTQTNP
jgi:hypothetical protein